MSRLTKEEKQRYINQNYKGDAEAYMRDMATKSSNAYSWKDIEASTSINELTEYTEEALNQILFQLGYLPKRQITLPHEPFIRAALRDYFIHLDFDRLCEECKPHTRQICLKDMEPHRVVKYDAKIYQAYEKYLPEYRDRARARIVKFVGHEPHLDHSVHAELIMREKMADDTIYLGEDITPHDYEVWTIIHYREHIMKTSKIR